MKEELQSQGLMDVFKLIDKELIDKLLKLSKCVKVENPEKGVTRIIIDFVEKD